jgi:hypothetical protein
MPDQRYQKEHQKNDKQQLRDAGSRNRYSGEAEDRRDQRYYKERYGPVQHVVPPFIFTAAIISGTDLTPNPCEAVSYYRRSCKSRALNRAESPPSSPEMIAGCRCLPISKSSTHLIVGTNPALASSFYLMTVACSWSFDAIQFRHFLGGLVKRSPLSKEPSGDYWRQLYVAALLEKDKFKRARKIAQAQAAIVAQRQRSLVQGTDVRETDIRERQVLDTALLSLQALANCLSTTRRTAA